MDSRAGVHLQPGQRLRIRLPALGASHRWVFEGGNEAVLSLEQDPGGRTLTGAEWPVGTEVWSFRARTPGAIRLRFGRNPRWTDMVDAPPPVFDVTVEPGPALAR